MPGLRDHAGFIYFFIFGVDFGMAQGLTPESRGSGQEVVKGRSPGVPATDPDCCRMQCSKISRYQIASFEGYSISKMIATRFEDCK